MLLLTGIMDMKRKRKYSEPCWLLTVSHTVHHYNQNEIRYIPNNS